MMFAATEKLTLRNHQQWSVHKLYESFRRGYVRSILVMPTGAGKRYLAVYLAQVAVENDRRMLFVTNRRTLVTQMFQETAHFGVDFGVIMSETEAGNPGAHVQIASIQTLESRYLKPGSGDFYGRGLPPANIIVIDEGHRDVDRYIALLKLYPDAKVVILTATPVGEKGTPLIPPYDVMIEGCLNSELISQGLLLPTSVFAPSEPNIEGVKIVSRGEYNQGQLGRAVKECTVFADVFNEWAPFADRKTIVFVPGVAFGEDLTAQFNRRLGGGQFQMVHAKTRNREEIYRMVREGDAKGLISVDVLKEGFDLPELSCGIDLQPNSQLRSYWQKIGRIKRAFDGQTEAVWLDFAGNYWRFPHPDEDPVWPQGNETTQDVIERRRDQGIEKQPIRCPKCAFAYKPVSSPPRCPQCGHVIDGMPIRVVRMGNGKLKSVPAIAKKKREKTDAQRKLSQWKSLLFGGMKTGRSLHACAAIYRHKTGEWPKPNWPGVMPKDSLEWKRKVKDVMTPRDLAIRCSVLDKELGDDW